MDCGLYHLTHDTYNFNNRQKSNINSCRTYIFSRIGSGSGMAQVIPEFLTVWPNLFRGQYPLPQVGPYHVSTSPAAYVFTTYNCVMPHLINTAMHCFITRPCTASIQYTN
jgi:hypothetical protein